VSAGRRGVHANAETSRANARRTGAKWRTGVVLGIHDGVLGSELGDAITV